MNCEYKCLNGWLPTHGGLDHIDNEDGTVLLILHPSEFTACPACNEGSWTNGDLEEN